MEHLDDLDNLEAKNVVNGRTGYDASSVNHSYLSERLLAVPPTYQLLKKNRK